MTDTRECRTCHEVKPLSGFHGFHKTCGMCRNVLLMQERNPDIEGHIQRCIASIRKDQKKGITRIERLNALLLHYRKIMGILDNG